MSNILKPETLAKIKQIKPNLLRASVWTFIGGVVVAAAMILVGNSSSNEVFAKIMGTLFILALMMLISVNNFRRLEEERKDVQAMALVGVFTNIVWALLWILVCWGVFDIWQQVGFYKIELSGMGKVTLFVSYLSALAFFGSNIMAIKEFDRQKTIRPLKITAMVCLAYEEIFAMITTFTGTLDQRFGALAGFAGIIWVITAIIALVMSRGARKQAGQAEPMMQPAALVSPAASAAPRTEEELRAEIEQRVRAEMIEKEVRAKVEAEQAGSVVSGAGVTESEPGATAENLPEAGASSEGMGVSE